MLVLVTRPEPEASELAAKLRALGIETSVDPLLVIEPCLPDVVDLAGIGALIVTSRNALKALAGHPQLAVARRLPVYVVGPGTARLARALGFAEVSEGPATGRDLAPVIAARHRASDGALLHLRGDHLAFDLKGALAAWNLVVREQPAYRSVAAAALRPETCALLAGRRLNAVLLMSPRTAATWTLLVGKAGLIEAATHPRYVCLSAAVARALEGLGPVSAIVPVKPNSEEMLALIAGMAAQSAPRPTRA